MKQRRIRLQRTKLDTLIYQWTTTDMKIVTAILTAGIIFGLTVWLYPSIEPLVRSIMPG